MSFKEKIYHIVKVIPLIYLLAFLFYKNHVLSIILCFSAFVYPSIENKKIIKRRKAELNMQFKDMLYSLHSSLSAGKSIELSFMGIKDDLRILYPGNDTYIVIEAIYIAKKLEMNETIEASLDDFAKRSGLEDIRNFAEVFRICKRTGGNVVEAIKRTACIINDKIEIKQDIGIMLASKNLERKVLNIMPIIILGMLTISAKDYIEPVYSMAAGRIVMSIAAVLIIVSYFISKKMVDIEI
jgi:tight adherence protein B